MKRGEVIAGSKSALVTGASKGIGREFALQLAQKGYNILMIASGERELLATAKEVAATNPHIWVRTHIKDMALPHAAEELYAWTEQEQIKIDILINNAGIFSFCDILSTPIERIERTIHLHDITSTVMCRLYAADMIKRGGGRILNMSSFSIWMPYPGLSLYSASKAYLKSFSVAFSKEVESKGVIVTVICPAGIATDLYGLSPELQHFGVKTGILMTPKSCARRSLNGMFRAQRCKVPDWWFRLFIPLCQLLRGPLMRWMRNYTMKFQK